MEGELQRNLKLEIVAGLIVLVFILSGLWLLIPGNNPGSDNPANISPSSQPIITPEKKTENQTSVFSGKFGNITIDVSIPESPPTIRSYRGYFKEGDLVERRFLSFRDITNPVPVQKALDVAKKELEQYGGLPEDAKLLGVGVSYSTLYNPQKDEVVGRIPQCTDISWYRTIDGTEIQGNADTIHVELGEDGELNRISKRWRTYEPLGNVSIIPASEAIKKLAAGEELNPCSCVINDLTIYDIHLSYYVEGMDEPEVILEPIWVLYGNSSGNYIPFYINAR